MLFRSLIFFKKKKGLGHACSRVGHELGNPNAMFVLSRILVICLFGEERFLRGERHRVTQ